VAFLCSLFISFVLSFYESFEDFESAFFDNCPILCTMSSYRFEDAEKKEGDCEIAANVASAVHYLPFKIEYEGTANVKRYFTDTAQPHADLPDGL
jgi:hypothetical protein